MRASVPPTETVDPDFVALKELRHLLVRHARLVAGLAALGAAAGLALGLVRQSRHLPGAAVQILVGVERRADGLVYPDRTRFRTEDLTTPALVREALARSELAQLSAEAAAPRLSATPVIPASVLRERERLRAAGQALTAYFPDEYRLEFRSPASPALDPAQARRFLHELLQAYGDHFRSRTTGFPPALGRLKENFSPVDYDEYPALAAEEATELAAYLKDRGVPPGDPGQRALIRLEAEVALLREVIERGTASKDPASAPARLRARIARLDQMRAELSMEVEAFYESVEGVAATTLAEIFRTNPAFITRALQSRLKQLTVSAERAALAGRLKRIEDGQPDSETIAAIERFERSYAAVLGELKGALQRHAELTAAPAFTVTQPLVLDQSTPSVAYATTIGALFGLLLALTWILLRRSRAG